jgi:chemotaxis protein CheZ
MLIAVPYHGFGSGRVVQRKVFRIEEMFTKPRAARAGAAKHQPIEDLRDNAYRHELAAVRDAIARSERELAALRDGAPMPRMRKELGAAITGMDEATHKILQATETIDESARALQASLQNDYNRGLAQEVLEQTLRIYEACNFQDLAGQRIEKAIAALQLIERQIDRLCDIWGKVEQTPGRRLVNGPRLDGDTGHADQAEIDRMFA